MGTFVDLMSKNTGEDAGKVAASVVSHRVLTMTTTLIGIILGSTFLFLAYETSPLVIEAQKTIAYEVAEQFGVPNWFVISMGSGGTVHSIWKGFKELHALGNVDVLPKLAG